jgi:predicted ArsR family transcriptional regulator
MSGPAAGPPPATAVALASTQRRRLFELLDAADAPTDAHELAAATGLHVTTVRHHLDVLQRAGLVASHSRRRASVGRPRTVYTAVRNREPSDYPTLTRLLAGQLADSPEERAARSEKAGLAWAAELMAGADPAPAADADAAARVVAGMFRDLGFDPELTGDPRDRQIRLRACPFRAAARANPEVVCSVHRGLLQGTLERLGTPQTTVRLLPFVEPDLCLAHLSTLD